MLENEVIYDIFIRQLDIKRPNYNNFHNLLVQVISSLISSLKLDSALNIDMIKISY